MTTAAAKADRPLIHLALLGLTVITTFTAFLHYFSGADLADPTVGALHDSLIFSLTLLAILGCHEMGHYYFARFHRVDTSLPYFIPLPMLGVGTLGAVIRIRGRIPNRNALVDIGAAGPLAGLVVAIPCLFAGLSQSTVVVIPDLVNTAPIDMSLWAILGYFSDFLSRSLAGTYTPASDEYVRGYMIFGDNLLMKGATWLMFGALPAGAEIRAHPMVLSSFFGMLVTMLNLIPVGQLDGGHLTYAMFGQKAERLGKLFVLGLFGLVMFASVTWVLWLLVASKLVGFRHPPVVDEVQPLTSGRKWICALCLAALIVTIIPVPMSQVLVPP